MQILVHLILSHRSPILCLFLFHHGIFSMFHVVEFCCSILHLLFLLCLICGNPIQGYFSFQILCFHSYKFNLYLFILSTSAHLRLFFYFLTHMKYIYYGWLVSLIFTNPIICVIAGSVAIDWHLFSLWAIFSCFFACLVIFESLQILWILYC